ncbi:MAG TPA: NAD(P)/FAD-dependent oxidoreductase [Actinomycetota bacterium]|nr:NAD(P)/FAD-dependent oxidoreductase [Actinomycetota bacterium]
MIEANAERSYDVVVIGAGPTGENVAGRAAGAGLRCAIVEAELVGGECSYWACIPSKALLRPPMALEEARSVRGAREAVNGTLGVDAVLQRRDDFVHHYDDGTQVRWLDGKGIDLVRGHGRLAGERRVIIDRPEGDPVHLTARHAVAIATGTSAAIPPIPGLKEAKPWTSREATSAKAPPASLAILGGGVVGCEMATAWSNLGTKEMTLIQRGDRLLPGNEAFAGEAVRAALEQRGVRVLLGATTAAVERDARGRVSLEMATGETIVAAELLVATGRTPRTLDIGLETVGLRPGAWLDVDDSMLVTAVDGGWLHAAGDVNHRALLTHMGKYQARICGDAIAARAAGRPVQPAPWSRHTATADHGCVPQVIFTEPEIGVVGLTSDRAAARGLTVRSVDYEIGDVSGASLYADGYQGHARMVVDDTRGVIVGMTLVGMAVGEMIHAATIAVAGEVPLDRLWHAVPSYPTMSEIWLRLLETYGL